MHLWRAYPVRILDTSRKSYRRPASTGVECARCRCNGSLPGWSRPAVLLARVARRSLNPSCRYGTRARSYLKASAVSTHTETHRASRVRLGYPSRSTRVRAWFTFVNGRGMPGTPPPIPACLRLWGAVDLMKDADAALRTDGAAVGDAPRRDRQRAGSVRTARQATPR